MFRKQPRLSELNSNHKRRMYKLLSNNLKKKKDLIGSKAQNLNFQKPI